MKQLVCMHDLNCMDIVQGTSDNMQPALKGHTRLCMTYSSLDQHNMNNANAMQ